MVLCFVVKIIQKKKTNSIPLYIFYLFITNGGICIRLVELDNLVTDIENVTKIQFLIDTLAALEGSMNEKGNQVRGFLGGGGLASRWNIMGGVWVVRGMWHCDTSPSLPPLKQDPLVDSCYTHPPQSSNLKLDQCAIARINFIQPIVFPHHLQNYNRFYKI